MLKFTTDISTECLQPSQHRYKDNWMSTWPRDGSKHPVAPGVLQLSSLERKLGNLE